MLPLNSGNEGWADVTLSTELLYPRNGVKEKYIAYGQLYSTKEVVVAKMVPTSGYLQVFNASNQAIFTDTYAGALNVDVAYDQLDRVFVTWEHHDSEIWIHFYNSLTSSMVTSHIATGNNPCCCMDELRTSLSTDSDIMLFYQRGDLVFYRRQRDRYAIEYPVHHNHENVILETCGMGTNLRLTLRTVTTDAFLVMVGDRYCGVDNNYVGLPYGEIP